MSSKQEKLAAARKKLKEFQTKSRGSELNSRNAGDSTGAKYSTEVSTESSPSCTPVSLDIRNTPDFGKIGSLGDVNSSSCHIDPTEEKKLNFETENYNIPTVSPSDFFNSLSGFQQSISFMLPSYSSKPIPGNLPSYYNNFNEQELKPSENTNINNLSETFNTIKISERLPYNNSESCAYNDSNGVMKEEAVFFNQGDSVPQHESNLSSQTSISAENDKKEFTSRPSSLSDAKQFFDETRSTPNSDSVLNEVLKPLQIQLQNHVQTISILVAERNELQSALNLARNTIEEKSGEIVELKKTISLSNLMIRELEKKFEEAEAMLKILKIEKEELLKVYETDKAALNSLRISFQSSEDDQSELRQKLEAKSKDCERLLLALHETQGQLSLSQIKVQQLNTGEVETGGHFVNLESEIVTLNEKIKDLEEKLEVANSEKEQSSQNFHVYAQQCNSQLSLLNSQLNEISEQNLALKQHNEELKKSISELQHQLSSQNLPALEDNSELLELNSQLNLVNETNRQLGSDLNLKEEELKQLRVELQEKNQELTDLESIINETRAENTRLLSDLESNSGNERLLAAMESDKVAAARAVSQNQKLKEQLTELGNGFVKLSYEKLELADELAHEKHVNKELMAILQKGNQNMHRLDYNHAQGHTHSHSHDAVESIHTYDISDHVHTHDIHDHDHDHCSEGNVSIEEIRQNDSSEIEELRNIIRQLTEDKTALLTRLNLMNSKQQQYPSYEQTVPPFDINTPALMVENAEECENSRILLHQMEEKVKRTMNEIAILDEEKQKLEHLVLQLQGETETIGEYISLYQRQRMLLRQRTKEKDEQLIQLTRDKEELRAKLAALDELVQHLLTEREQSKSSVFENINVDSKKEVEEELTPENTAGKIRALITEIGSTNLVNNHHSVVFEHCPCCSGRLITI